jgi:hypothetical protein
MASSATLDPKVVALGGAVFNLRQDIDLHRAIGLSIQALARVNGSKKFFGRVQQLALTSIAVTLCKIFERNPRWSLYSIPAILTDLPGGVPPHYEHEQFEQFVRLYGANLKTPYLNGLEAAYDAIVAKQANTLKRLKEYRDKQAAHLEFDVKITALPSHDAFEELWEFAKDFYAVVHQQYNGICPAPMGHEILAGYARTLKQLGIEEPILHFASSPQDRRTEGSDERIRR